MNCEAIKIITKGLDMTPWVGGLCPQIRHTGHTYYKKEGVCVMHGHTPWGAMYSLVARPHEKFRLGALAYQISSAGMLVGVVTNHYAGSCGVWKSCCSLVTQPSFFLGGRGTRGRGREKRTSGNYSQVFVRFSSAVPRFWHRQSDRFGKSGDRHES